MPPSPSMECWVLRGRVLPQQILDMARQRNKRVKVVGGGHSPSDIACTDDFMIQMGKMNKVLKVRRWWPWHMVALTLAWGWVVWHQRTWDGG